MLQEMAALLWATTFPASHCSPPSCARVTTGDGAQTWPGPPEAADRTQGAGEPLPRPQHPPSAERCPTLGSPTDSAHSPHLSCGTGRHPQSSQGLLSLMGSAHGILVAVGPRDLRTGPLEGAVCCWEPGDLEPGVSSLPSGEADTELSVQPGAQPSHTS